MHKLSFFLGVASMTALIAASGCALVPPKVQLGAGQALLVAEAAADGVNHAAATAAPALHGENALRVKDCVDATNNGVDAAHALYANGDVAGTVTSLGPTFSSIADCTHLTKGVTP